MLVEEFKQGCINLKPDIVVQKYLIEGESYFFTKVLQSEEFAFKKEISEKLDVHIREIVIVGSGKLGFSLKPESNTDAGLYLFRNFDEKKVSDLDVAIVSSTLFDKEMKNLYNHAGYYKQYQWSDRNSFAKYVLKGKLATRFLPNDFKLTNEIRGVQNRFKMEYARDINFEIYKSWHYFETYHQENIKNIQINLIR